MLTWTRRNNKYGPPTEVGKIGSVVIAIVEWNGAVPKDDESKIVWVHFLPGMKINNGRCKTEAEGKKQVEAAVVAWLKYAGFKVGE